MKRLTFLAAALASLFLAGSCRQENLEPAVQGTTVKFQVEVPGEIGTKAVADGKNVDILYYAIYKDGDGSGDHENGVHNSSSTPLASGYIERTEAKKFNITFDLLVDQEYVAIFWAQVGKEKIYYEWPENDDLRIIKYKDANGVIGNMEDRAAFFRTFQFSTYQVEDHSVTLYRPFAQLNLGTTLESLQPRQGADENGSTVEYDIDVLTSQVTVTGLAKSFNTIKGLGVDEYCGQAEDASTDEYIFKMHEVITKGKITDEGDREYLVVKNKEGKETKYEYVAMNYLFANGNIVVEYDIVTDKGTVNNKVTNVPVAENFRTNIIGNLLTSKTDFEIVVDENFDNEGADRDEKYDVYVWNGTAIALPEWVEDDPDHGDHYAIGTPDQLAGLAALVNGTFVSQMSDAAEVDLKAKFVLTQDIDLNNLPWTPIGNAERRYDNQFKGTFDGNGYTIRNLYVDNAACAGLFGNLCGATIQNLNIDGFELKADHYAGAIVGWVEVGATNVVIDGCKVSNGKITLSVNNKDLGDKAGSIVGYAYCGHYTNNTATDVVINGYRDLGGIAGHGDKTAKFENNTVSNVTITADLTVSYDGEKDCNVGDVVGRINNDKVTLNGNNVGDNMVRIRKVDSSKELEYAVAEAKSGDTIYLAGEVTMPYFTDKALNFEGITKDAIVKQSPATHVDAFYEGAELNFKNVTLVGTSYTGDTQGYQKSVKETYTDCHFENYIMFAGDVTVVTDCTFENEGQYFWTGTADDITFNNCKFKGTERAVKVCTVGNNGERVVTFNDCEFYAGTQVKAALEIDGTKGSSFTVYINNCTQEGFAPGEFTDEPMFNIEGAENVTLYVNNNEWVASGLYKENGELVAYTVKGLQYALNIPSSVKFGADIKGGVTVPEVASTVITIDGQNHKYDGCFFINGKTTYADATTVFENINFETSDNSTLEGDAFIYCGEGRGTNYRYPDNVTVKNCTFTATGPAVEKTVGLKFWAVKNNILVENTTATGMHSLMQLTSSNEAKSVVFDNVTVKESKNGISLHITNNVEIKNSNISAREYGIRANGEAVANIKLTNSTIEAKQPVIVRKLKVDGYTIDLSEMTLNTTGIYQVILTKGDDSEEPVKPEVEYTLNGADEFVVFPEFEVDENQTYEASSAQLVDHILNNGGNVNLSDDVVASASETKGNSGYGATGVLVDGTVLDGNGKTFTVTDANGTWDCAIATKGGTIKNLTVSGAFRGIFMPGASADVYIDKVTFADVTYTFNSDAGNKKYGVYISNSTLNGWTSHSDVHKEVVYTNCSFGEGRGYAFCRPYGPTSFVGCEFEEGFAIDARGKVTFENCTIAGVALTAENLSTLVTSNIANATVK